MANRILIVDDEPTTIELATQKMRLAGYQVDTASNGVEALKKVDNQDYDLIISDVVMPEMDGVDLFKELRARSDTSVIPIIIITDSFVIEESFRKLGVDDFLAKPLDPIKLLKSIDELIRGKAKENNKVVIVTEDYLTGKEMAGELEKKGTVVSVVEDGRETVSRSLVMNPKIILLDVLIKEIKAKEVIKAIRCFSKLSETSILTFTHFEPEELGDVDAIERFKDAKNACNEVGATKYIGRFTRTTFLATISEFWE